MNLTTLEPLYSLAAQAMNPPDRRWLAIWRWLLGNVQIDLWLNSTDTGLTRPLLAVMHSLSAVPENVWLPVLAEDYNRVFTSHPHYPSLLPALTQAAERWGYVFDPSEELGLTTALACVAHLCRVAAVWDQEAEPARRQFLAETLCPVVQTVAEQLRQRAATEFYQSVGFFLPALVSWDLGTTDLSPASMKWVSGYVGASAETRAALAPAGLHQIK